MPNQQELQYVDATGQVHIIPANLVNTIGFNHSAVQALPNQYTSSFQGLTPTSGILTKNDGLFGTSLGATQLPNLSQNQMNALNNLTNGNFGSLSPDQQMALIKNGTVAKIGSAGTVGQANQIYNSSLNDLNANKWTTQNTLGAVGLGLQAVTSIAGIHNAQKQLALNKQMFAEQTALNRANFRNSARTLNNQYRDQASGRGTVGMGRSARSALGRNLQRRLVEETY